MDDPQRGQCGGAHLPFSHDHRNHTKSPPNQLSSRPPTRTIPNAAPPNSPPAGSCQHISRTMLKPKPLSHSIFFNDSIPLLCARCHSCYIQSPLRHRRHATTSAVKKPSTAPQATNGAPKPTQKPIGPPANPPSSKNEGDHTPRPLSRPIGMPLPPKPGENTGIDSRSYRQRRDDLVNYEKHLERRQEMYV